MKLYCKCGNCVTNEVQKVSHKEAFEVKSTVDYGEGYELNEYKAKAGFYHKWKRYDPKRYKPRQTPRNVYVVSEDDLNGSTITNASKGCCTYDFFDVTCSACNTVIGWGNSDCWQTSMAGLLCTKVKVGP